jgi:long-chain acyl-CoA synthetase
MGKPLYYRLQAENLALLYRKAAETFEAMPAFALRESALKWKPVSYRELYETGLDLATGFIELGVAARDHVGIFSDNRFEWILTDYAVQLCGAADVPRGRDVTTTELDYIIQHSGMKVVCVENSGLLNKVQLLKDRLPNLQEIIVLDPNIKSLAGVRSLMDICEMGAKLRQAGDKRVEERMAGIQASDLFTLIYTSGTTGTPKGVMLTHANMMSQIRNLPGQHNCNDRVLSVLPIWHIFERLIEMYTISFGGCTYYSSIQTLGDDMRHVEPTFMASAPRLWEKLHEKIIKNIKASHWMRQILFHIAYFLARQYKNSEYYLTNKYLRLKYIPAWIRALLVPLHALRWLIVMPWYGFFNAAVLERIRLGAGGSLKVTISGGGALPLHIDRFFNYVGIPVLEGYGMTETTPVIAVRPRNNLIVATVGPPIAETEVRIIDNQNGEILYPNAAYPHNGRGQRGEIWVRGPQIMKGYYKDQELTDSTIINGWLKTGDLGVISHNNCLKILGRSKATIVLSSGENVEPEPLEMSLQQSSYIENCMVVGQDKKYLCVLIVPSLLEYRQAGFNERTLEDLAQNDIARKIIKTEINRIISPANGFKRYEQIHDFSLLAEHFQVGEELTNLFKIKRHIVQDKYAHKIASLYESEKAKTKK